MRQGLILATGSALALGACDRPAPWDGPVLRQPRDRLTVEELSGRSILPLLDTSYFAKPVWALDTEEEFSGSVTFAGAQMHFPLEREHHPGEDLFPAFTVDLLSHDGALLPRRRGLIDTRSDSDDGWDVILGTGRVWKEEGDGEWSRASFPLNLTDRYVGSVRNCVATFAYTAETMSNAYVQCGQETADVDDKQIGDIRAMIPAAYAPKRFADAGTVIDRHAAVAWRRLQVAPLSRIDSGKSLAAYFGKSQRTSAPTSIGAIYLDGKLYLDPPKTRQGPYPYPNAMRHGVYSVTKSLAGALAMFYFAERYGEAIFDERIADHVPALAGRPEWAGVTFGHALDMATGTRGGEDLDLLFEPLMAAPTAKAAIANIARLGDGPGAPGERFNYATTNFFVLSCALQHYVAAKEGRGLRYWDLVRENVLEPIRAADFDGLETREADPAERIPTLGYGARPSLDTAAKIAALIANEGVHAGRQILNRNKIREALGRGDWRGYRTAARGVTYRHAFWSRSLTTDRCTVTFAYMEGFGGNHILLLPSGLIILRFMDEFDRDLATPVRAAERIRSSCG